MPNKEVIGERIKKLRQTKKMSRIELAEAVGITPSAIAMYEQGERIPNDDIKVKLSNVLGRSVAFIFFKN